MGKENQHLFCVCGQVSKGSYHCTACMYNREKNFQDTDLALPGIEPTASDLLGDEFLYSLSHFADCKNYHNNIEEHLVSLIQEPWGYFPKVECYVFLNNTLCRITLANKVQGTKLSACTAAS